MLLRKKVFAILAGVALTANVAGCGKEEEKEEETPQTLGDVRGSGGSGGSGSGSQSQEVTELTVVQSTMVPGSLIVGGASLTDGDDPCENSDGFFDCQPELLKVYVKMSKDIVKIVTDIYAGLDSTLLPILPIGNGKFDIDDPNEDITALHYNIVDADEFAIMGETAEGPAIHVAVNRTETETTYILRHDGTKGSDDDDKNKAEVTVTYRSATDFDVDFVMEGTDCDPNDIRSPRRINIKSSYANAVWTGKAQMYMPLWKYKDEDGVTCDTTATEDTKMFFYTDFVGTDANTTASIYLADKGLTDVANFGDYDAADFCTQFSDFCFNGYGFGDPNPVSSYANSFCVTKDADTEWGAACTDLGTDLYSSSSLWDLPAALEAKEVTLPTSL